MVCSGGTGRTARSPPPALAVATYVNSGCLLPLLLLLLLPPPPPLLLLPLRPPPQECARYRDTVVAAGGLLVIGTSLNESARIELQLRGRAGRQGDPGESVVLLDCIDPLMAVRGLYGRFAGTTPTCTLLLRLHQTCSGAAELAT